MDSKVKFRGLRIFFSVLLTAVMLVCTLASAGIWSLRNAYTSEKVYERMAEINWAELELSYDGKTMTLCEIYNHEIGIYIGEMDAENFDSVVYYFSLDTIITSFVQDLRAWLFDYAPAPRLDADEIADTVLSRVDGTLLRYISFIGDPQKIISGIISSATESADISEIFEEYGGYRIFVSDSAMYITASSAAVLLLIILILNSFHISSALIYGGTDLVLAGAVLSCVHPVISKYIPAVLAYAEIPKSTFNIVYTLLSVELSRNGFIIFSIGAASLLIGIIMCALFGRKADKSIGL